MGEWFSVATLATLLCGLLMGGMVSFSLFLTPLLRRYLRKDVSRDLLARLLPVYYHYNTALALLAGVAVAMLGQPRFALTLAIIGATFIFARTHLLRAIRAMRPADDQPAGPRYRILQATAVGLNLLQIATVTAVLAGLQNLPLGHT